MLGVSFTTSFGRGWYLALGPHSDRVDGECTDRAGFGNGEVILAQAVEMERHCLSYVVDALLVASPRGYTAR
jgi:hypothetical protein